MGGLSETDRRFSLSDSVVDHIEHFFNVEVDVDQQIVEKVFNFEMAGFARFEGKILHVRWLSEDGKEMNITVRREDPEVVRLQAYITGKKKQKGFGMTLLSVTTDHCGHGDSAVIFGGLDLRGEEVHLRLTSNDFEHLGIEPIQALAA